LERLAEAQRESVAGSLTPREETRLLAAARDGDPRALRQLLTALSGPAFRFGRGFCRDRQDAEDVMQEVLAALARGVSTFRGDASLTSWAYVVARRVCMRHRRLRSGQPARVASLDAGPAGRGAAGTLVDHGADPLDRLERHELGALLERAIIALPAPQRDVLLLRDVEGMSASAVGKALRLGERAVKSRLHRARMALRRTLAPQLMPPRRTAESPGNPVATRLAPRRRAASPAARCPDTALMISRYLEGEITPARCDELAAHVEGCPECRSACDTLRLALGACRTWGRAPLPADLRARVRDAIRRAADEAGVARERVRA
jgi:RNA polymerase sigma-70 factor (ECF subfamily)